MTDIVFQIENSFVKNNIPYKKNQRVLGRTIDLIAPSTIVLSISKSQRTTECFINILLDHVCKYDETCKIYMVYDSTNKIKTQIAKAIESLYTKNVLVLHNIDKFEMPNVKNRFYIPILKPGTLSVYYDRFPNAVLLLSENLHNHFKTYNKHVEIDTNCKYNKDDKLNVFIKVCKGICPLNNKAIKTLSNLFSQLMQWFCCSPYKKLEVKDISKVYAVIV